MRKTKAVLALFLAAALCGCSAEEEGSSFGGESSSSTSSSSSTAASSSESSSSSSSETSSTESSSESEPESKPASNETFLTGLAGDTILKTDIKQIFVPNGVEADIDNFSEENFSSVLCMGFIYASEPKNIFRTNLDNPDVYNEADYSFSDVALDKDNDYVRLNVGESMCGMTLTFAETNFARTDEQTMQTYPGSYFCYGSCEFSGEIELEGYINIHNDEGSYTAFKGDVNFVPTSGEIPVVNYRVDPENGIFHAPMSGADKNLAWLNEYGKIYLGNADTDETLRSLGIPEGSDYVKCKIVIDKLKYTSSTQMMPRVEARIVSFDQM